MKYNFFQLEIIQKVSLFLQVSFWVMEVVGQSVVGNLLSENFIPEFSFLVPGCFTETKSCVQPVVELWLFTWVQRLQDKSSWTCMRHYNSSPSMHFSHHCRSEPKVSTSSKGQHPAVQMYELTLRECVSLASKNLLRPMNRLHARNPCKELRKSTTAFTNNPFLPETGLQAAQSTRCIHFCFANAKTLRSLQNLLNEFVAEREFMWLSISQRETSMSLFTNIFIKSSDNSHFGTGIM